MSPRSSMSKALVGLLGRLSSVVCACDSTRVTGVSTSPGDGIGVPGRAVPTSSGGGAALPVPGEALWLPQPTSGDSNDLLPYQGSAYAFSGRVMPGATEPKAPQLLSWIGGGSSARFSQSATLTVRQAFDGSSQGVVDGVIDGGRLTPLRADQTVATFRGLDPVVIHTVTLTHCTEPMFGAADFGSAGGDPGQALGAAGHAGVSVSKRPGTRWLRTFVETLATIARYFWPLDI